MAEWKCVKSLYNGGDKCDVWENECVPERQIVVFGPSKLPLVCNTETCCSHLLKELPDELYSAYPHLCVPDKIHNARLNRAEDLYRILDGLEYVARDLYEHMGQLHPSNTPGWKRLPGHARKWAEWIHDEADNMEGWADEVEEWLEATERIADSEQACEG